MNQIKKIFFFTLILFIFISISFFVQKKESIRINIRQTKGIARQQLYSGYYALVVGCGDYRNGWEPLPNKVNDAREVAELFKSMGFEVDFLENPDSGALHRSLNKMSARHGRDENKGIIFWFSGHGHTLSESEKNAQVGYLVLTDTPAPSDKSGFLDTAISIRDLETIIRARHVMMLFDACFSGVAFPAIRSEPMLSVEEIVKKPARQFIIAGNEYEKNSGNSTFKDVFLHALSSRQADKNKDGYIIGTELGFYIQDEVVKSSSGKLHPQFRILDDTTGSARGNFVFMVADSPVQPSKPVLSKAPPPKPPAPMPPVSSQPVSSSAESQPLEIERYDYSSLETYVLQTPRTYEKEMETLAQYLIRPARNDREKAWVIFRWITDRIEYDVDTYFSGKFRGTTPEEMLRTRKAICEDYATLFEKLATLAGLEIITITGYGKGYRYFHGATIFNDTNHKWNAVRIDGKWRLLDSAWGAGYVVGREYKKAFDPFYFLTPPEHFIYEHLPESSEHQFLNPRISLQEYEKMVNLRSCFFRYGLSIKAVEELAQEPGFRDIPEMFDYIDKKISIHQIPLNRYLKAGAEYSFHIESPYAFGIAVVANRRDWDFLDENENEFSGNVTAKSGILEVRITFQEDRRTYKQLLKYEVE